MKKRSFANRLSLRIMAVLIVVSTIIMIAVYLITKDSMAHEAEARYEGIILHTNEKIRGVLSDVYVAAINNVDVIERDLNDPDLLQQHLERMVSQNQYMSSCRLIFEPDFYPQKGHNFEIYAWRDSSGVVRGKQMNERQRHNREDAEIHKRYEQGFSEQSYSFIIDSDGTYLIHPMEERVLQMKIQDVMKATSDTLDDAMARRMLNRESGTCRINNDGQNCWVFYSYVKYADWTVVIVVPEAIINYKGNLLANIILAVLFVGLLSTC